MRIFSYLIFLITVAGCADTSCSRIKPETYEEIVSGVPNQLILNYIGGDSFNKNTSIDEIKNSIEDVNSSFYSVRASCVDSHNLYFNISINEHEDFGLSGFVILRNGKFHSGPFLIPDKYANSEVIFIQADREFKKQ